MFDISVKILGNQDFFPNHLIETNDTLEILDNEYEGTEKTDQLPDSKESIPFTQSSSNDKQSSHSSYPPKSKYEV
jgi:hypothetical protein